MLHHPYCLHVLYHVWIQRGDRGPRHPPLKNHKNIGLSCNTGLDPLKYRSCQASIQCWVIIGTPAKRHLMVFFAGGPMMVCLKWYLDPLPSSTKKKKRKKQHQWTPSGKTFWIRTCSLNQNQALMMKNSYSTTQLLKDLHRVSLGH